MKIHSIYILSILIGSCGQLTNSKIAADENQFTSISPTNQAQEATTGFDTDDLKGKVFEIGSSTHFTDTCAFYFACDCCSGELLFASESTFYSLSYCMSDQSLSKGNYKIENEQLVLNFGAKCVVRSYNYENEVDTSAVDFYMTDTLVQEISRTYEMKLCENKIAFTNNEHREMAIEVKSNFSERMAYLKKEGFLKQFEIIKN